MHAVIMSCSSLPTAALALQYGRAVHGWPAPDACMQHLVTLPHKNHMRRRTSPAPGRQLPQLPSQRPMMASLLRTGSATSRQAPAGTCPSTAARRGQPCTLLAARLPAAPCPGLLSLAATACSVLCSASWLKALSAATPRRSSRRLQAAAQDKELHRAYRPQVLALLPDSESLQARKLSAAEAREVAGDAVCAGLIACLEEVGDVGG